jgi:SET domain-containing protein
MLFAPVIVKPSENKGKGLFSEIDLKEGDTIEIAPVLLIPFNQKHLLDKTHLYNYYFLWGTNKDMLCLALGYGSLYNHSFRPNVAYRMDFEAETITFVAWQPILKGQELFINYNGDEDNQSPLWFTVA